MTAFDTVKKTSRTHARTHIHILAAEMLLNVPVEQQMDIHVLKHLRTLAFRQTDRLEGFEGGKDEEG